MCFNTSAACKAQPVGQLWMVFHFPTPGGGWGLQWGSAPRGGSGAMDGGLKDKRAQPPPAPASEGDAEPQCPLVSAGELNIGCSGGLVVPLKST